MADFAPTIGTDMAIVHFEVEVVNEFDGQTMQFDYDFEIYDDGLTREEIDEHVQGLTRGSCADMYNDIMNNLSIVPTIKDVTYDND